MKQSMLFTKKTITMKKIVQRCLMYIKEYIPNIIFICIITINHNLLNYVSNIVNNPNYPSYCMNDPICLEYIDILEHYINHSHTIIIGALVINFIMVVIITVLLKWKFKIPDDAWMIFPYMLSIYGMLVGPNIFTDEIYDPDVNIKLWKFSKFTNPEVIIMYYLSSVVFGTIFFIGMTIFIIIFVCFEYIGPMCNEIMNTEIEYMETKLIVMEKLV